MSYFYFLITTAYPELRLKLLTEQGVSVEFIKENLVFTGEDSPMSNLLLFVMEAFAEFERALIRERQLEGIAIAKKKGLYKGRKKSQISKRIWLISINYLSVFANR